MCQCIKIVRIICSKNSPLFCNVSVSTIFPVSKPTKKPWKPYFFIVFNNAVDNGMESTLPTNEDNSKLTWMAGMLEEGWHPQVPQKPGEMEEQELYALQQTNTKSLHHGLHVTDCFGSSSIERLLMENKLNISLNAPLPWRLMTYWLH